MPGQGAGGLRAAETYSCQFSKFLLIWAAKFKAKLSSPVKFGSSFIVRLREDLPGNGCLTGKQGHDPAQAGFFVHVQNGSIAHISKGVEFKTFDIIKPSSI